MKEDAVWNVRTITRNTQRAYFQAAVCKRACQSIYQLKNKDGRKICCLLTGWTSSLEALMLLILINITNGDHSPHFNLDEA
jgi:hypothetical protein